MNTQYSIHFLFNELYASARELRQGRMINNALSLPRQLFIIYYFRDVEGAIPYRDKVAPFHYSHSLFNTHYFRDVEDAIPYISIYLLRKFDIAYGFDIFRKRNSIYFALQNENQPLTTKKRAEKSALFVVFI